MSPDWISKGWGRTSSIVLLESCLCRNHWFSSNCWSFIAPAPNLLLIYASVLCSTQISNGSLIFSMVNPQLITDHWSSQFSDRQSFEVEIIKNDILLDLLFCKLHCSILHCTFSWNLRKEITTSPTENKGSKTYDRPA